METALWVCLAVIVVSAVCDVAKGQIPNTVSLGGLAVGLAIHSAKGAVDGGALGGVQAFGFTLVSAFACALIPFVSWRRNGMGGGDVKLFAAIGALTGPVIGLNVVGITFILVALVLSPYRVVRHGGLRAMLTKLRVSVINLFRRADAKIPTVDGPKLPPVILAPTIGVAFMVTIIQQGVLP